MIETDQEMTTIEGRNDGLGDGWIQKFKYVSITDENHDSGCR